MFTEHFLCGRHWAKFLAFAVSFETHDTRRLSYGNHCLAHKDTELYRGEHDYLYKVASVMSNSLRLYGL